MNIKTNELTGAALNWAVAKCEGVELFPHPNGTLNIYRPVTDDYAVYEPDARWEQGGPIIDREKMDTRSPRPSWNKWSAHIPCWCAGVGMYETHEQYGPTMLIAAMRCFVASKLGDEVEVPDELATGTAS